MAGWYVRRGEKVIGPVDLAKLKESVAAGKLLPTDQLAKDAAGPWTEASRTTLFAAKQADTPRVEPAQQALVPKVEYLPVQEQPIQEQPAQEQPGSGGKLAVVIQTTNAIMVSIGRGTLAVGGAVVRSLSTRAKRQHELKLAKIQAQALADSQRPQDPAATSGPITLAPQIVQSTVVKVVNKNSGGCGCSGCGVVLLLILLGVLALAVIGNMSR